MDTQCYKLYLCDGNSFEIAEPLGIPFHRTFAAQYEDSDENGILRASEKDGTVLYVPKKNILYLRTAIEMKNQRRNAI